MAAINLKNDPLTFSEVSQEADYYDIWLFTSARRYKHISMYETDKSASALAWHSDGCKGLFVGTDEAVNNELILYSLPIVNFSDKDRLSKNREMSILAATTCAGACHAIVSAPSTFMDPNIVVRTEQVSAAMFIHSLQGEMDDATIHEIKLLHTENLFTSQMYPPTVQLSGNTSLLCSVSLQQLMWYDVFSLAKVEEFYKDDEALTEPVSTIFCLDDNICITCGSRTGRSMLIDRRVPNAFTNLLSPVSDSGARWLLSGMRGNDVIRLNDNNELTLGDIRKPGTDKCQCMLEAPIRTRTVPFTSQVSKNMLSLSGKDNQVRLYDLEGIEKNQLLRPEFFHDGHLPDIEGGDMPRITSHCWSQTAEPLIASASNTGQLHIWKHDQEKG
ncbi:WD repeat-containing protein 73-like [Watersipora subatra]|uniref:WD repeat-containing protein 73-like n=1 Tax=Watersipora subatra TaxID=2589382 RepID=UPI00355AF824